MLQKPENEIKAHNLPQQFTSFVGREQELADVNRRLTDPACRLLTLVGPGGIGKTRLAMQVTAVMLPLNLTLKQLTAEIKTMQHASAQHKVDGPGESAPTPTNAANQLLLDPLTSRELEVLQLIANGLTNKQIADKLIISKGTVKYYTSHIYSKLQVANRTQAVAHARELGILTSS